MFQIGWMITLQKQAGLEVPHSRFKKGLSAKKIWVGTDIKVGDRQPASDFQLMRWVVGWVVPAV